MSNLYGGSVLDFIPLGKKAKEHAEWKRKEEKEESKRKAKKAAADDELEDLERKIRKAELLKKAKEAGLEISGASPLDAIAFGLVRSGCVDVRMGAVSFVPTTTALGQQVMNELALAAAATPLVTVDLGKVPPEMQTGANNTIGAHYKVAYWLAVASRIASFRAQQAGEGGEGSVWWKDRATSLYRSALAASAKANVAATTDWVPVFKPFVGSSDPAEIEAVFVAGAAEATKNGIGEVAVLLVRIGSPQAIAARQAEAAQESGLRTLGVSAAATVLGPAEAGRLEALSKQGYKVRIVEAIRPYTQEELDKAKQAIAMFDEVKANVAILDRIQRSGVVLPPRSAEALEAGKTYLLLLSQPTELLRKGAAFLSGGGGRFGVAPLAAAAAALGVTEGTILVAAAVAAAVIVLAAYFAVTQYVQAQVAGGMTDVQGVLATCMSDPSLPPATREMCAREHARSVRNMPSGPEAMLWAGAALAAIGAAMYFFGPILREISSTGASELRAYRASRESGRSMAGAASANVTIDVRSHEGQFYAAEVVDDEVVGRGPFRASRAEAQADRSALFGHEGEF